jgi:transposase
LRWQRLKPMEKLARMLLDHLEGILNYCRTKVPMGVIEAVNGNIKALLRRGRGYRDVNYLLLKAQRLAATLEGENWGSHKRKRPDERLRSCESPRLSDLSQMA